MHATAQASGQKCSNRSEGMANELKLVLHVGPHSWISFSYFTYSPKAWKIRVKKCLPFFLATECVPECSCPRYYHMRYDLIWTSHSVSHSVHWDTGHHKNISFFPRITQARGEFQNLILNKHRLPTREIFNVQTSYLMFKQKYFMHVYTYEEKLHIHQMTIFIYSICLINIYIEFIICQHCISIEQTRWKSCLNHFGKQSVTYSKC